MDRLDISRNDIAARQELTQQALALSIMRPLAELLNSRLKGKTEELDECDVVSAAMWLFDHMLYYETRSSCPGTTRQEAETVLVKHFQESNPDWEDGTCTEIARNIFRILTPRDGFRHTYYDFNESCYKEHFFRLIDWELRETVGVLYRLTTQGIILYSTRLEDSGLESAMVSAIRANRTLRRGEINLAIELAQSTIMNLRRVRVKISAGLRDARTGDTTFTFLDRMKPLLDDSYDLLEEILKQTAETLNRINQEIKDATPEKRRALLRAEESFQNTVIESRAFKNFIRTVQQEFAQYRRELIGLQDHSMAHRDLTTSLLKPLLKAPVEDIAAHANVLLSRLLPPNLESRSTRKAHYCIDPSSILSTYRRWLEQQDENAATAMDENVQDYSDPPPLLGRETIERADRWMTESLAEKGELFLQDVVQASEQQSMEDSLVLACMLLIGAQATSDKDTIEVMVNGRVSHEKWSGDNLGVAIRKPS